MSTKPITKGHPKEITTPYYYQWVKDYIDWIEWRENLRKELIGTNKYYRESNP